MDEDDLRKLEAAGSELAFGAGQMLIESGKPGTGLYVVLEGKIVVEAPEGTRELGPGAVVGERALLSEDGTRSARVRALTFGKVVAVDRAEVDRLCAEDPGFAERLAQLVSSLETSYLCARGRSPLLCPLSYEVAVRAEGVEPP